MVDQQNVTVPISAMDPAPTPSLDWLIPVVGWDPVAKIYRAYKMTLGQIGTESDAVRYSKAIPGGGLGSATAQLQADLDALIAAGGGTLRVGPGTYDITGSPLTVNLSAITTRMQSRICIQGEGNATTIRNASGAGIVFLGNTTNPEAYFQLRNLRLLGNNAVGSIGLILNKGAFNGIECVSIEGFELGSDLTDVDQTLFHRCQFRFNVGGFRVNAKVSVTDGNSITFLDSVVGNNTSYGIQATNLNQFSFVGGSIQYNGVVGGPAGTYGAFLSDTGSGYGNVLFAGMSFEGNGGEADIVSQQISPGADHCNFTFISVAFMRTSNFGPVGYATNQVKITGSQPDANYSFVNCNFYGKSGYVASAARPAIVNTNVNARVQIDGFTKFWSTLEGPVASYIYTGYPSGRMGAIKFGQTLGGESTLIAPNSAASFSWTLPAADAIIIGADTTKTLTNTTFNTAGAGNNLSINGVAVTGNSGTGGNVLRSISPAATGTMTVPAIAGGSVANQGFTIASTTNGAPSGDLLALVASTINLNGITTPAKVNIGAQVAPAATATLTINQNTGTPAAATFGTPAIHVVAADGANNSITMDGYAAQTFIESRYSGGTQAAKTAAGAGALTFSFLGRSWDTVAAAYGAIGSLDFLTMNATSGTDHSGRLRVRTVAPGSTSLIETASFWGSGGFSAGSGATDPGAGNIKAVNALEVGSFTVAALPSGVTGRTVFCSNCRMLQSGGTVEGAGAGTGGYVTYNGSAWKVAGTNVTASA